MKRYLPVGISILTSAVIAHAQAVPLQMNLQPGQSWHFDDTQDTEQKSTATLNGQSQPFGTKTHEHLVGTMEVVNVSNGAPSTLKVTFDKDSEVSNEFNGQTNRIPFPYGTSPITLSRQPDGSVTDDFQGQAPPQASTELHSLMERDLVVMPAKPVSVGDEWSGDPATMGRFLQLGPKGNGDMTMKLLSVKTVDGRQAAEVKVSMAVLNDVNGMQIKAIAQGIELIDLGTGHSIKSDMNGTIDLQGQQPGAGPNGQQVNYDITGHGTMVVGMTSPLNNPPPANGPMVANNATPAPISAPAGQSSGNPLDPTSGTTNLAPFSGKFTDGNLTVELAPAGAPAAANGTARAYSGKFTTGNKTFDAAAAAQDGKLNGQFIVSPSAFPFTAVLDGDTMTLTTGTTTYHLKKINANPLDTDGGNPLSH